MRVNDGESSLSHIVNLSELVNLFTSALFIPFTSFYSVSTENSANQSSVPKN